MISMQHLDSEWLREVQGEYQVQLMLNSRTSVICTCTTRMKARITNDFHIDNIII